MDFGSLEYGQDFIRTYIFIIPFKCIIFYNRKILKIVSLKYHLCSISKRFMGAMRKMSTTFTASEIYVPQFKVFNNNLYILNRSRSFIIHITRIKKYTLGGARCGLFCFLFYFAL